MLLWKQAGRAGRWCWRPGTEQAESHKLNEKDIAGYTSIIKTDQISPWKMCRKSFSNRGQEKCKDPTSEIKCAQELKKTGCRSRE